MHKKDNHAVFFGSAIILLVGFGRAKRPCAARTRLFRLTKTGPWPPAPLISLIMSVCRKADGRGRGRSVNMYVWAHVTVIREPNCNQTSRQLNKKCNDLPWTLLWFSMVESVSPRASGWEQRAEGSVASSSPPLRHGSCCCCWIFSYGPFAAFLRYRDSPRIVVF